MENSLVFISFFLLLEVLLVKENIYLLAVSMVMLLSGLFGEHFIPAIYFPGWMQRMNELTINRWLFQAVMLYLREGTVLGNMRILAYLVGFSLEAYEYTLSQWVPEPLMTVTYKMADIAVVGGINEKNTEQPQTYFGLWTLFVLLSCFVTSDWIVKESGSLFLRMVTAKIGLGGYFRQTIAAHILFYSVQTLAVERLRKPARK